MRPSYGPASLKNLSHHHATKGEDVGNLFAFTEAFEDVRNQEKLPVGLKKMKKLGLINPIIEIDTLRQRDHMSTGEM